MSSVSFDRAVIEKYNVSGPRYTSYPTVLQFDAGFDAQTYRRIARASNRDDAPQLSLYFHLPFCARLCYYCACNKVVTKRREQAVPYLRALTTEIALHAQLYEPTRLVTQLHWGGGTPTFLSESQMRGLMRQTRQHFRLAADDAGEFGIELDPREVRPDTLPVLREIGFNRASLGIQDFEPAVQKAVNRIQSEAMTAAVIEDARTLGFRSVSVDLIYGLPFQTLTTMARTLAKVVALDPDRISIYNYAHLPDRFPPQKRLLATDMPNPDQKLDMLKLCIDTFGAAGYVYIGMDHFAKPTDELARAQVEGTLYRNFQGYSTHAESDLVGMGLSAIGTVSGNFYQNDKDLDAYNAALEASELPIIKGLVPDAEDRLRRAVIMHLICNFELTYAEFELAFGIEFDSHFAPELDRLEAMARDNLLTLGRDRLTVTPSGRMLIRNICMVFDRYSGASTLAHRYSKAI
ncbi:MAG: oxygen-independent coproporphyrinogen III oxidase [Gammaproteobacteria bacterium]|nr:oxygen-independent coproporphyrinogen III oxidase [Gammaproteobacteria bacterium]